MKDMKRLVDFLFKSCIIALLFIAVVPAMSGIGKFWHKKLFDDGRKCYFVSYSHPDGFGNFQCSTYERANLDGIFKSALLENNNTYDAADILILNYIRMDVCFDIKTPATEDIYKSL